jgi:DsbC/DsbD-like thiol-disulfide interchange protein
MNWACALVLAAIMAATPALAADPFASDWAVAARSQARLIADGAGGAGIEIELAPGAITYWRDPGESGVPPTFDFSASQNVASAQVDFPAPTRIAEPDGSSANGYRERVVFPVRVTGAVAGRPTVLRLNASYAVCEKICLPARASLSLELPSGLSGSHDAALAAARNATPRRVAFTDLDGHLNVVGANAWSLCFPSQGGQAPSLFLEAPRGAWIETGPAHSQGGRACFSLTLREPPTDTQSPLKVTATLTGAERAQETSFELPR